MTSNPYPIAKSDQRLTLFAWGVTALVSVLPDILCIEAFQISPRVLLPFKIGLLALLAATAFVWKPLRGLRNFFLAMLAFFGLSELRLQFDFTTPALQNLFGGSAFDARMQAEQTGKLVLSLVMIGFLFLLGYKRRKMFLACGDLRAPIEPVKLLGFLKPVPWTAFGLQWGFYIAAALAIMLYLGARPDGEALRRVLPILPSVLFYAALNAFNEEVTYRVPMLTTLEPVAGSRQALWMAAYFFGIAHYFGTPGGILGGIASVFMGWILGKAVVETRGLFWAWWIHFLSDVTIFFFVAVSLVG